MMSDAADAAVSRLLEESDAAFAAGDPDRWTACFEVDGRVLLLHRESLDGHEAIRAYWELMRDRVDTSDWNPVTDLVEIQGDHAFAFRTYTERLRRLEDGSRTLVRGRLAVLMRRGEGGDWRIRLLMNSHSHPMEPIP
jgi:ketosteroid isomerase-like protein